MTNIVLPDPRQRSLAFYLAMEEFVAKTIEGEAFFVWQSEPTVIFGRNQVLENEVNLDYCRQHGIEVVRRKSGGGCVYSDKGNIMVSFISGRGDVSEVFDRFLSALTSCLCGFGVDAVPAGMMSSWKDARSAVMHSISFLTEASCMVLSCIPWILMQCSMLCFLLWKNFRDMVWNR